MPSFPAAAWCSLALGIVGATVMPHVVYLHSALTEVARVACRDDAERRSCSGSSALDVIIALGARRAVNLAMLFVAAAVFHARRSGADVDCRGRLHGPEPPASAAAQRWRSAGRPARVGAVLLQRRHHATGQVVMQ